MSGTARETWHLTVELPADVGSDRAGRFVARLLKHLLRTWGIKCVALRDTPPPAASEPLSSTSAAHPSTDGAIGPQAAAGAIPDPPETR